MSVTTGLKFVPPSFPTLMCTISRATPLNVNRSTSVAAAIVVLIGRRPRIGWVSAGGGDRGSDRHVAQNRLVLGELRRYTCEQDLVDHEALEVDGPWRSRVGTRR